jgi:hypothetical protein
MVCLRSVRLTVSVCSLFLNESVQDRAAHRQWGIGPYGIVFGRLPYLRKLESSRGKLQRIRWLFLTIYTDESLRLTPTCSICGMAVEDEHHALVVCTQATTLRSCLRDIWALPAELEFQRTGDEWFLQLISNAPTETRVKLLFLF